MSIRLQHILPSGLITFVGAWVAWISYTQEPASAFLFPRLVSTIFLVLAIWTFAKAILGISKTGGGISWTLAKNIAPGMLIGGIYIFWAAKAIGFYVAFGIAFFLLLSLYDPAPHTNPQTWGKRIIITASAGAVMYIVFAVILSVYTPRGILL